jgi:hypothetical protein
MKTKPDDSTEGEHRLSEFNDENPRVSTDREQDNNEHVVPKSRNNKQTDGNIYYIRISFYLFFQQME